MPDSLTEAALFELLSLECRVDHNGTTHHYNTRWQLHRVHGPAVVCPSGYRAWYQSGQLHRLDGPAVDFGNDAYMWYIDGYSLSEAEWQQRVASMGDV